MSDEKKIDSGPYFIAGHGGPQSWRDSVRSFALNKFGPTGKHFAESMIGMSEEDKLQRYLDRTYGYATPHPDRASAALAGRPVSDLLKYGLSDFGLLDTILGGTAAGTNAFRRGVGTTAAIAESALLGGDAYGEYQKGDNLTAGIMSAFAGTPLLLRYFAGRKPPPKGQMELELKPPEEIDLKRRKFSQGVGLGIAGLGALAMAPPSVFRKFVNPAVGKSAAKLLPVSNPVGNAMESMVNVGNADSYINILENMPKFGGKSSRQLLLDYGETADEVNKMLEIDGVHWGDMAYPITDIFDQAARYDRVLTFDEFKKIAADTPKRYPEGMPAPEFMDEGGSKLAFDIFEYEPFQKSAYNEYLRSMKFLKETPEGQDLIYRGNEMMKLRKMAENEFGGFPNDHLYTRMHSAMGSDMFHDGLEGYQVVMRDKLPKVDFNDPIVGQKFSDFSAVNTKGPDSDYMEDVRQEVLKRMKK